MKGPDVRNLLARKDKWFVGGGRRLLWAPPFPKHADCPGFWDHGVFLDVQVENIFTMTLLDEQLRELPVRMLDRSWTPSDLTQRYEIQVAPYGDAAAAAGLRVTEQKAMLPSDVLASVYTVTNDSERERRLTVVQWTCQLHDADAPSKSLLTDVRADQGSIRFTRKINDDQGAVSQRFSVALGAGAAPDSATVKLSDGPDLGPRWWDVTPFPEQLALGGGRLSGETELRGLPYWPRGFGYMAQMYTLVVPAGGSASITLLAAVAAEPAEADQALRAAQAVADPIQVSRDAWDAFFATVPAFRCSDPYLERYYWYRYYGLQINTVQGGADFRLPYPTVFEGINAGWFRHAITYSAPVLMMEARWLHDPAVAEGLLRNFILNQRENGSFPGAILHERNGKVHAGFYHGYWGKAVRDVDALHGDTAFLAEVYEPLCRYLAYFDRERDREGMGLYDVIDHWETGQEFMSRYLWVDPDGDRGKPLDPRLKGVDATVYIYDLQQTAAWMAAKLGRTEDAARWGAAATKTKDAIRTRMWDPETQMFCDVNAQTGERSPVKASVIFYPFLTDLATPEHLGAIYQHLLNENEFWTPYPLPSTSVDDETYSPVGEWHGRRLVCPWNGRNWLMTTSHVTDALARAAQELDPALAPKAAEMLSKFIRMLFLDGDVNRPSSYEYYNPITGQAPYFRGTEEYMHSYIADLIVRYVAGLQPGDGTVTVNPLPMGADWFSLENVRVNGQTVTVHWRALDRGDGVAQGLTVLVDGAVAVHRSALERVELTL